MLFVGLLIILTSVKIFCTFDWLRMVASVVVVDHHYYYNWGASETSLVFRCPWMCQRTKSWCWVVLFLARSCCILWTHYLFVFVFEGCSIYELVPLMSSSFRCNHLNPYSLSWSQLVLPTTFCVFSQTHPSMKLVSRFSTDLIVVGWVTTGLMSMRHLKFLVNLSYLDLTLVYFFLEIRRFSTRRNAY